MYSTAFISLRRTPAGAQSTTFVDILPNVVTLTLVSDPRGIGSDAGRAAGGDAVVGGERRQAMVRTLGAPFSEVAKSNYNFLSWSDGGSQTHSIQTPAVDTAYTAFFRRNGRK
jgi:hypothetical protein